MRRRAAQALVLLHSHSQQQSIQQAAAQVAALHAGCLSVPNSATSASSQQEQAVLPAAVQQSRQTRSLGRLQDYHAAALAHPQCHTEQHIQPHNQQPWHAATQPLQQQIHRASAAASSNSPSDHANPQLGQLQATASSTSTSQTFQQSSVPAAAAVVGEDQVLQQYDQPYGPGGDVFELSSAEQQYKATVAALRRGQSKNLDQLAYMFDPQAVLAAPDKGAAVFEALMFAAARLQDLQLLRQLLRCTAAAGNALSSSGHRAVLHGLASCNRPVEALDWLQKRVPEQLLTPQLMRSLVQQLLNQHQIQAAQRALDYAEPKLLQRWQQELQGASPATGSGLAAEVYLGLGEEPVQQLSLLDMQELPSLRLLIAGRIGTWPAVQEQWQAVLQQAEMVQPWLQSRHTSSSPDVTAMQQAETQQLALLGVGVWSNYTTALGKVIQAAKHTLDGQVKKQARQQMQAAALQTLDRYQDSAWDSYVQWQARHSSQAHVQDQQQQHTALAAQQHAARLWQQHLQAAAICSWQELDAAQAMPQPVAHAADKREQQLVRRAVQDAMYAAANAYDAQQVQQLLKLGSLLKISPRGFSFEVLLQLQLKQGAPPEALEELLSEMMGFGAMPTVTAYEAVMEAYALHQDGAAAEAVLDRMQAAGLQPVLRTYNRLLHGLAMNGNLAVAICVYNRLRLQGLQPDHQTFRAAFKCVRMYAGNVRVTTARTISLAKPGDRDTILNLLSQRAALFASAYSQLANWQRDMVAAGLKHTNTMMLHLTQALERLGALQDCLQLARLAEDARPGDFKAHRAALRAAGRARDAGTAAEVGKLVAKLAEGQGLTRHDYLCIINSQFWLEQNHEQLLQTVAAMKAAGHELDDHVLQHLLHVYCHNGMWGEALQVLSDVAAGRLGPGSTSTAASASKQQVSTGARKQATAADDSRTIDNDRLWHVVLRKLWEKRASDELLNEFLQHMAPAQVLRFKLLYGLHAIPGQQGRYTLQALEDWQLPLQLQAQLQQQQQQQLDAPEQQQNQQQQLDAPEQLQKLPGAHTEHIYVST